MKIQMLQKTPLFKGMSEAEIVEALKALRARERRYLKGSRIFSAGDKTESFGLILDGMVVAALGVLSPAPSPYQASLTGPGQFFAAESALLKDEVLLRDYTADEDCRIVFLDASILRQAGSTKASWLNKLYSNLLILLAKKNSELDQISSYASLRSARARITAYLESMALQKNKKEFDLPFDRQAMADYLNLDRSALSRELSRMQAEGLIDFKKNRFTLHFG